MKIRLSVISLASMMLLPCLLVESVLAALDGWPWRRWQEALAGRG